MILPWYTNFENPFMASNRTLRLGMPRWIPSFSWCHFNHNGYILRQDDSLMFIVLYADDILITCNSLAYITAMKINLHVNFLMSDLGILDSFLRIEITQCDSRITMAQCKYALNLISQFHMANCKPISTPFLSGVKLEVEYSSPLVNNTLYQYLVGSLI